MVTGSLLVQARPDQQKTIAGLDSINGFLVPRANINRVEFPSNPVRRSHCPRSACAHPLSNRPQ